MYLASEPSREVSYEAVRNFGHHIPSANRPPIQAATHVRVKVTASKVSDVRDLWSNGVAAPFSACPLSCLCPLPSSASPLLTGVFDSRYFSTLCGQLQGMPGTLYQCPTLLCPSCSRHSLISVEGGQWSISHLPVLRKKCLWGYDQPCGKRGQTKSDLSWVYMLGRSGYHWRYSLRLTKVWPWYVDASQVEDADSWGSMLILYNTLYTVIFVVIPVRQSDDGTAKACKLMDNMKVMLVLDVRCRLYILYVFTFVFLRIIVSPNSLLHFPLSMGRNRRVLSKQHISDNDFAYLCLRFLSGKVEKPAVWSGSQVYSFCYSAKETLEQGGEEVPI